MKRLFSLFALYQIAVANTYYCNGSNCVLPSQQEQNSYFSSGIAQGNSYKNNNQDAPSYNYANAQNDIESQIGANIMSISSQGTQNSQDNYANAGSDSTFLNNQAKSRLIQCQSQNDPACLAVAKYNDDSTQQAIQSMNFGQNSILYSRTVTPDPNNSSCFFIRSYQPIDPTETCEIGAYQQIGCEARMTTYAEYMPPQPADGTTYSKSINVGWDRSASSLTITFTINEGLSQQNLVNVYAYVDGGGFNGGPQQGSPYHTKGNFTVQLVGGTGDIQLGYARYWGNGHTDATSEGRLLQSPGCSNGVCVYNISIRGQSGGDGGNGDHTTTAQVIFSQPQTSRYIPHYQYSDGCQNYR